MKHLWETNKFLSDYRVTKGRRDDAFRRVHDMNRDLGIVSETDEPLVEAIAGQYEEYGYKFVPLVRQEISLLCSLDILFLRRDFPGSIVAAGDLDNRIKTLIDALRRPQNKNELRGNQTPATDETPFYCLLEDDKLITGLSVETDTLLDAPTGDAAEDRRRVKLIVTVKLSPYQVTYFNLNFAGD